MDIYLEPMSFLCLLVKHNTMQLPCYLFFPSFLRLLGNIGKFEAKKYLTELQTINTVQLVVTIKANFSGLFFF